MTARQDLRCWGARVTDSGRRRATCKELVSQRRLRVCDMTFNMTDENFAFTVSRTSTGEVLFDTS